MDVVVNKGTGHRTDHFYGEVRQVDVCHRDKSKDREHHKATGILSARIRPQGRRWLVAPQPSSLTQLRETDRKFMSRSFVIGLLQA